MSESNNQQERSKTISTYCTDKEKEAWKRRKRNLENTIKLLEPLQQRELELYQEKQPILEKIETIRSEMVLTCIHPEDKLVYNEENDVFECKFCGAMLNVPIQPES